MTSPPSGVQAAGDAELLAELAKRIKDHVAAGHEDTAEHLIEELLEQTAIQKFVNYWELGDFVYHENPYFTEDQIILDLSESKIRRAGILKDRNADNPYGVTNPNQDIPKPPSKGGPSTPPVAYYHRLGRDSRELGPGAPLGDDTPADDERYERNIIKEVEIEYGPDVPEATQCKPPHVIIVYGGGDH